MKRSERKHKPPSHKNTGRRRTQATSGAHDSVRRCYSTWATTYFEKWYQAKGAYPPVHRDLVHSELSKTRVRRLLDAGCGPASILRSLTDAAEELYGFDLTPEMVAEAQRVLAPLGVPAANIWVGDVLDKKAFRAPPGGRGYDATISLGVFPHIPRQGDLPAIRNIHDSLRPGGLAIVEMRNELFALFTANRYTFEFIRDRLVDPARVSREGRDCAALADEALEELKTHFRMDLPPVRTGEAGAPGYDEVLSRTHNPFEAQELFREAGFTDVKIAFYHYHPLPPMFESRRPDLFRRLSLKREDPFDWRGHFMASAFLLMGRRHA